LRRILLALILVAGIGFPTLAHADTGADYMTTARITYYTEGGQTADGSWTYAGEAACSTDIPFGATIVIDGWYTVTCHDRGLLPWTWIDVYGDPNVPYLFGDYAEIEVIY